MYTLYHSSPSVFYDLPIFFLKPHLPLPPSSSPFLPSLPHVSPLSLASRRPDNTPLTHQGHQHRYTTIRPTEAAHRGVIGHIGLLDHPAIKMGVKYFLGWPPYAAVQMEVVKAHDGRWSRIGGVYIQFLFDMVVLLAFIPLISSLLPFLLAVSLPITFAFIGNLPSLSTASASISCSIFCISFHFLLF